MALVDQSLTYGNVTSSSYGIYIGGEGVFNAPKRDTTLISIPGRNGDYAQDNGRYENITVTYPAFYKGSDLSTFTTALANFRAAMCAQIGYQRLTDTINTDEYRQALFIDGITVTPVKDNTLATFDLVFNCKPERWLTSGETRSAIANNGTLTNPTQYAAKPLIEVTGYGDITIQKTNGDDPQVITIEQTELGLITIGEATTYTVALPNKPVNKTYEIDTSLLANGDTITVASVLFRYSVSPSLGETASADSITNVTGTATTYISGRSFCLDFGECIFTKGTTGTFTAAATLTYTINGTARTRNVTVSITYDGATTITLSGTNTTTNIGCIVEVGETTGYSTVGNVGTMYIDCATGLCWTLNNGTYVSANNYITLPMRLPELYASDISKITYPNTITSFYITPRWWRV